MISKNISKYFIFLNIIFFSFLILLSNINLIKNNEKVIENVFNYGNTVNYENCNITKKDISDFAGDNLGESILLYETYGISIFPEYRNFLCLGKIAEVLIFDESFCESQIICQVPGHNIDLTIEERPVLVIKVVASERIQQYLVPLIYFLFILSSLLFFKFKPLNFLMNLLVISSGLSYVLNPEFSYSDIIRNTFLPFIIYLIYWKSKR